MEAILVSILGKFLPYIVVALGVLFAYLGIKRRGTLQERARWQEAQTEAKREVESKLNDAASKDADIDKRTNEKLEKIREANKPDTNSGPKFNF